MCLVGTTGSASSESPVAICNVVGCTQQTNKKSYSSGYFLFCFNHRHMGSPAEGQILQSAPSSDSDTDCGSPCVSTPVRSPTKARSLPASPSERAYSAPSIRSYSTADSIPSDEELAAPLVSDIPPPPPRTIPTMPPPLKAKRKL